MSNLTLQHRALLGLKPHEADCLEELLRHPGPQSASDLAIQIGVPRTTLLDAIRRLKVRGLVEPTTLKKRRLWQLASRQAIGLQLEECRNHFSRVPGGRVGLKVSPTTEFVIHKGAGHMIDIFERIARLHKNERLLGIQPNKSLASALTILPTKDILKINDAIKKNKIIVEGILQEGSTETMAKVFKESKRDMNAVLGSFVGRLTDNVEVPSNFLDFNSELYIFRDVAILLNWQEEVAIEIKSPEMHGLIKAMFECVKFVGKKMNQREDILKALTSPKRQSSPPSPRSLA